MFENEFETIELGPEFCRCCTGPLTRCGCGEWLPCDCSAAVHACGDEVDTASVALETSPGRVSLAKHIEIMTGGR